MKQPFKNPGGYPLEPTVSFNARGEGTTSFAPEDAPSPYFHGSFNPDIGEMAGNDVAFETFLTGVVSPQNVAELRRIKNAIPHLKGEAKRKALKELRGFIHRLHRQTNREQKLVEGEHERDLAYRRLVHELGDWLKKPLQLQRLEDSGIQLLLADLARARVFSTWGAERDDPEFNRKLMHSVTGLPVFVIEHDWARAFESAPEVFTEPVSLPAEDCIFEFRISGRRVIVVVYCVSAGDLVFLPIMQGKDGWATLGSSMSMRGKLGHLSDLVQPETTFRGDLRSQEITMSFKPMGDADWRNGYHLLTLIDRQIRAVSIALDAQVATKNMVRMAYRSNLPRPEKVKKPFYSYHVISLAHRTPRAAPAEPDPGAEPHTRKRLHFRRGHWRHFENFKTWINWMLVGDPDLGFVDKHYKL